MDSTQPSDKEAMYDGTGAHNPEHGLWHKGIGIASDFSKLANGTISPRIPSDNHSDGLKPHCEDRNSINMPPIRSSAQSNELTDSLFFSGAVSHDFAEPLHTHHTCPGDNEQQHPTDSSTSFDSNFDDLMNWEGGSSPDTTSDTPNISSPFPHHPAAFTSIAFPASQAIPSDNVQNDEGSGPISTTGDLNPSNIRNDVGQINTTPPSYTGTPDFPTSPDTPDDYNPDAQLRLETIVVGNGSGIFVRTELDEFAQIQEESPDPGYKNNLSKTPGNINEFELRAPDIAPKPQTPYNVSSRISSQAVAFDRQQVEAMENPERTEKRSPPKQRDVLDDFALTARNVVNDLYEGKGETSFKSYAEAREAVLKNGRVDFVAKVNDTTIPRTLKEKRVVVRALRDHMLDMIRDKDENKAWPSKHISIDYIESTCWEILDWMIMRQTEGPLTTKGSRRNYHTFEALLADVLKFLSEHKSICKQCTDESRLFLFIDNPWSRAKGVETNKSTNLSRQITLVAGRRALEIEFDTPTANAPALQQNEQHPPPPMGSVESATHCDEALDQGLPQEMHVERPDPDHNDQLQGPSSQGAIQTYTTPYDLNMDPLSLDLTGSAITGPNSTQQPHSEGLGPYFRGQTQGPSSQGAIQPYNTPYDLNTGPNSKQQPHSEGLGPYVLSQTQDPSSQAASPYYTSLNNPNGISPSLGSGVTAEGSAQLFGFHGTSPLNSTGPNTAFESGANMRGIYLKDIFKNIFKDIFKNIFKDIFKNIFKAIFKHTFKDPFKHTAKDTFKDPFKHMVKDLFKHMTKDTVKDPVKRNRRDTRTTDTTTLRSPAETALMHPSKRRRTYTHISSPDTSTSSSVLQRPEQHPASQSVPRRYSHIQPNPASIATPAPPQNAVPGLPTRRGRGRPRKDASQPAKPQTRNKRQQ
ncbi:hypothetical protein BJX70DRAFT_396214 [Aspergillus crustosus]